MAAGRWPAGSRLQWRALEAVERVDVHTLGQQPLRDLVRPLAGRQVSACYDNARQQMRQVSQLIYA